MLASDITNRALQIIGVLASGEVAGASDAADALQALRDVLAELRDDGVNIPDYTVASLSAAMTVDPADKAGLSYLVAMRIGETYGWEPSALTAKNATDAIHRLRTRYFQIRPADYSHMPGNFYDDEC